MNPFLPITISPFSATNQCEFNQKSERTNGGKNVRNHPKAARKKKDSDAKNESTNQGKLIIYAPSAPADISYPTDLGLLNLGRIHTEKIIDILYKSLKVKINKKPRT